MASRTVSCLFYYYTCIAIYNARKFSDDTVSEALAVSRWAALIECLWSN